MPDYRERYFRQIEKRLDTIQESLDNNSKDTKKTLQQAQITNGRVNKHDDEIKEIKSKLQTPKRQIQLPQISTQVLFLIAMAFVITLLIIANLTKTDLSLLK